MNMDFDFIHAFANKVSERGIDWTVKGLVNDSNQVFTLGSDSKLIGRIFELISAPIIMEIAEEHGYTVVASQSQTVYPDFTIRHPRDEGNMIAVDVKTTYRRGARSNIGYTLGSYASYLRNGTKNISYPYALYGQHIIIGFVYDRNPDAREDVVQLGQMADIEPPYRNVEFFVQEKYKIAGDRPGSGNTENIGSFATNDVRELREGKGPFGVLGEDVFEHYWKHYPKYREANPKFVNLDEYFAWLENIGHPFAGKKARYQEWKKGRSL